MKVCFVSQEIAPFSPGGVGVLVHNLLKEYSDQNVDFHVLSIGDLFVDEISFNQIFPNATLWNLSKLVEERGKSHIAPPEWAFTTHYWHYKSYQIAQALLHLSSKGIVFDIVEFPDWCGLAFCSCQEKLLGNLDQTLIAVRLHSTDSILRSGEPVLGGEKAANLSDLERKSLQDADIVVAHLQTIVEATREHFGFTKSWMEKVRINRPPVLVSRASQSIPLGPETPICFPSKIQFLKRPDVFLNGALSFVRTHPEYEGPVVFAARPSDAELNDYLVGRIPEDCSGRVSFLTNASGAVRDSLTAKSISVFPSPFESFCLAAYEASLRGGWVVLNAANPAFCDDTVWQDGVNCLKFDGTSLGLAETLSRAWGQRDKVSLSPVKHVPEHVPYWKTVQPGSHTHTIGRASKPLVSVVIPYFNMGKYIYRTIESALSSTYSNIEIVLVDDCSSEAHSQMMLEKIRGVEHLKCVRTISSPFNMGLAAARNRGIRAARGEFILTLDADDLIHKDFIELAVAALLRNPEYVLVVPQTAYVADTPEMAVVDYALFTGEAVRAGTMANRFSTATSLGRRELYLENPYDESLTSYEDWDFYARAVNAGKRFIVTSDIFFFYRRREGSMIAENTRARHVRNLSVLRSKQRVVLGSAALDLNVMTDSEAGYHSELGKLMSPGVEMNESGEDAREQYIRLLKAQVAHQSVLLSEANSKLKTVKELVEAWRTGSPANRDERPGPARRSPLRSFVPRLVGAMYYKVKYRKAALRIVKSGELDPVWYVEKNPDVAAAGMDPALHFILYGRNEGRLPRKR